MRDLIQKIELLEKERKYLKKLLKMEEKICKVAGSACIESADISYICRKIISEFLKIFNLDYISFYYKEKGETFKFISLARQKKSSLMVDKLVEKISIFVMKKKKSIFVFNIMRHKNSINGIDISEAKKINIGSLISLPVVGSNKILYGILTFISYKPLDYKKEEKNLLKMAANMFSIVLDDKNTEEKLIETGKRYQALLEHLPVGVYRSTPQGKIIEANKTLAHILGYENVSELKKINVNDLYMKKEARMKHLEKLERASVFFEEFELRCKDDTTIWVRDYPHAVREKDGRILYYDGILVDITERKKMEETLRQSERDYKELFENAHDAIIIFSIDDEIVLDVNQRACELYGFKKEEFIGLSLESISKDVTLGKLHIKKTLERGVYHNFETVHYRKDGSEMILEINGAVVSYKGKKAILSINRDITERKQMEKAIRDLAYQDYLTGLPNRLLLNDRLNMTLAHAKRKGLKFVLMFLDIDQFKDINDLFGHRIGDLLLKEIANRLKKTLRKSDTIARMGGDEFVILLPEITYKKDVEKISEKILKIIQEPYIIENYRLYITTSIGIAFYPKDGKDIDTLMKNADFAMYQAKIKGKNNYQFYSRPNSDE
ncbi:diguanylate cyclase [Candidatus Aminicenantes bacterium AC-708-I09]|nr:diguanylate cyclase [Candidatus Aminicenantes bacterium AC-708-I09]